MLEVTSADDQNPYRLPLFYAAFFSKNFFKFCFIFINNIIISSVYILTMWSSFLVYIFYA